MARKHSPSKKSGFPELNAEDVARHFAIEGLTGHRKLAARLRFLVSNLIADFNRELIQTITDDADPPFYRPTRHDLKEFDSLLFSLAHRRRRKQLTFDEAVAAVNKRWPRINLASFVTRLDRRKGELELPEPKRTPAIAHLDRIKSLAAGSGGKSALAKDFLRDLTTIDEGRTRRGVDWSKYSKLLYDQQTSLIRLNDDGLPRPSGGRIECYTKSLELLLAKRKWDAEKEQWERAKAKRSDLSDWFERHGKRDQTVKDDRAYLQKAKPRWRKRKERSRKKFAD